MHPTTTIHLRAETKPHEQRSALTPRTARALLDAGYTIRVERSKERCFENNEFEAVDATLVEPGTWRNAPREHIILGLKELPPNDTFPLVHTHVTFAHCFKRQAGWESVLSRFPRGGGTLLDLEFLTDDSGRRVAAFGFHAGFAGAALALLALARQRSQPTKPLLERVKPFESEDALVAEVQKALGSEGGGAVADVIAAPLPRVFVMGAKGRCGRGAVALCERAGIPPALIEQWDMDETRGRAGPYAEIGAADVFINCIYLGEETAPFVSRASLAAMGATRRLRVICDVSCDASNPGNPVPVYEGLTSFDHPAATVDMDNAGGPPLHVIAIDHLPTLLPREASEAFGDALLPSLLQLRDRDTAPVWQRAEQLYRDKVAELPEEMRRLEPAPEFEDGPES